MTSSLTSFLFSSASADHRAMARRASSTAQLACCPCRLGQPRCLLSTCVGVRVHALIYRFTVSMGTLSTPSLSSATCRWRPWRCVGTSPSAHSTAASHWASHSDLAPICLACLDVCYWTILSSISRTILVPSAPRPRITRATSPANPSVCAYAPIRHYLIDLVQPKSSQSGYATLRTSTAFQSTPFA